MFQVAIEVAYNMFKAMLPIGGEISNVFGVNSNSSGILNCSRMGRREK